MGASSSMRKKNIRQVKLFRDYCKIWGTKVHSNLLPKSNLPNTEKFFSEAPVVSHGCWQNNKENSERSDRENSFYEKMGNKTYLLKDEEAYIDPNRTWSKVICTYKFFQGERMWKVKTGERPPFWCTLLVFTRSDGQ